MHPLRSDHTNTLVHATSPYLLQHAGNPVHWQQYGPDAFELARQEDKPLLISIGYAACHWCHVMEHESFENQKVADFMNEKFICVKVDREELPHVDHYYMSACQVISGQGGWPLNMFVTADGKPFTGGTYYPPKPGYGRPSWMDVLAFVSDIWKNRREEVLEQADKLSAHVHQSQASLLTLKPESVADGSDTEKIFRHLMSQADEVNGGWGGAPKFPAAMVLQFLIREEWFRPDDQVRKHVQKTLRHMHYGGIWDQLGGGFCRYTVDASWLIPHFEKMLYDNALLLETYALAYGRWQDPEDLEVLNGILAFANRELVAPGGGYFASLDADAEGEEGRYYVWTNEEIESLLADDAVWFKKRFQVSEDGNWEGRNILHRNHPGGKSPSSPGQEAAMAALLQARSERVKPALDDKILVSWNGLFLHAMLVAYRATRRADLLQATLDHTKALLEHCHVDGILYHVWCKGQVTVPANLDDHAALIRLLLALFGETGNKYWYDQALSLAEFAVGHFSDPESPLFYDHLPMESLPVRTREVFDYAQPSGNALFAQNAFTLYLYSGEQRWLDLHHQLTSAMQTGMERFPQACGQWLQAAQPLQHPVAELVTAGPEARSLLAECHAEWYPLLISLPVCDRSLENMPFSTDRFDDNVTRIFLCKDHQCAAPVSTVSEYAKLLKAF